MPTNCDHVLQVAIIWEGDEPTLSRNITYGELSKEVSRIANVMKLKVLFQYMCLSSLYATLSTSHFTFLLCTCTAILERANFDSMGVFFNFWFLNGYPLLLFSIGTLFCFAGSSKGRCSDVVYAHDSRARHDDACMRQVLEELHRSTSPSLIDSSFTLSRCNCYSLSWIVIFDTLSVWLNGWCCFICIAGFTRASVLFLQRSVCI